MEREKETRKRKKLLRGFQKTFHHFSFHLLNQFACPPRAREGLMHTVVTASLLHYQLLDLLIELSLMFRIKEKGRDWQWASLRRAPAGTVLQPAGEAPRGAMSSVQMAVGVCFQASSLGNFKQGEDRRMIYGKLISNRFKSCFSCHLNLLLADSVYFLHILNI